jgi:hypothetical protein
MASTELGDHRGGYSAHSIGVPDGYQEVNGIRTAELTDAASPWYRRPGILIAAAALTAGVGIVVSGPGEPDTALGGIAGTGTPWSASFSLVATDFWEPPPPPPEAAPPPPPPPEAAPPAAAPRPAYRPVAAPPPPPPPQLALRWDASSPAIIVTMTNNANNPPVGCVRRIVPTAGVAAMVNFNVPDEHFTVNGSEEARVQEGRAGPATGSTFHATVSCDNGLSASVDAVY